MIASDPSTGFPSFRQRLVRGVAFVYVALALIALAVIVFAAGERRERERENSRDEAVEVARAVDADLRVAKRVLAALGGAIDLDGINAGDHERLRAEASRIAEAFPAMNGIAVGDQNGRFLVHTLLPPDGLPERLPDIPVVRRFLKQPDQAPWVDNLTYSPGLDRDLVPVLAPVERRDRYYLVATQLLTDGLLEGYTADVGAPGESSLVLVDRNGAVVAQHGSPLNPSVTIPSMIQEQSDDPAPSLVRAEGMTWASAPLVHAPWRAVVGVPTAVIDGPFLHAVTLGVLALLGGLAALGLAIWLLSRPFLREIAELAAAGDPSREDEVVTMRPHTAEGEALQRAFAHYSEALAAARMGRWEWNVPEKTLKSDSRVAQLFANKDAVSLDEVFAALDNAERVAINTNQARAFGGNDALLMSDAPFVDEFHVEPSGERRWLRSHGRVVERLPGGEPARLAGLTWDITDRREAEEATTLLARELRHRVRNLFGIVVALVGASARGAPTPQEVVERARGRILALSRAHDASQGEGGNDIATLAAVADAVLKPYGAESAAGPEGERMVIEGPEVPLEPSHVTPLGLLLHEWATNAVKHGALGRDDGRVELRWRVEADVGANSELSEQANGADNCQTLPMVMLEWRERLPAPSDGALEDAGANGAHKSR